MRRIDKEIANRADVEAILREGRLCHLAMADEGEPYVVPMNYGFRNGLIYLHCAAEGRKLDMLQRNGRVCFAVHLDEQFQAGPSACKNSLYYRSAIGGGTATIVTDEAGKIAGLDAIMAQFGRPAGPYAPEAVAHTVVIRIQIDWLTGKQAKPD